MENDDKFKAFLDRVLPRPLPNSDIARIRTLAKELAEGATAELWEPYISAVPSSVERNKFELMSSEISQYVAQRWDNNYPNLSLLQSYGYLGDRFQLTKTAFNLIEEVEPSKIFISYRRKDSSAFALLVLLRMKSAGLEPFLDMSLEPGEDWHAGLKERIQQRDNFILLIGKDTLSSKVVQKEIEWAIEARATIIPIWHNQFEYVSNEWGLSDEVNNVVSSKHAIKVLEESASGYYKALVELLNRFGITP